MIQSQVRKTVPQMMLCALLAFCSLPSNALTAERPPVSWVNPKLPTGPGLTHHLLQSKAMGHPVGYVVWTPEGYDESGKTRYPVIYFLHGIGGNESADAAGFSSLAARGIRDRHLPPALCVFPNGGRSGYRGEVEKMIIEELIPLIDKTYPTRAGVNGRAVTGFSMGGAGAVQLAIAHPETFCVGGSWGGGMRQEAGALLATTARNAENLRKNRVRLLLVNGAKDRPDAFNRLAQQLDSLKVEHQVVILPDTSHNLGLYYQRAGELMTRFLGQRLKE